ncbi:unnamed protein product [Eretmochelys imbricata]
MTVSLRAWSQEFCSVGCVNQDTNHGGRRKLLALIVKADKTERQFTSGPSSPEGKGVTQRHLLRLWRRDGNQPLLPRKALSRKDFCYQAFLFESCQSKWCYSWI